MAYQPGLHIIAELSVTNTALLEQFQDAKDCIDNIITRHSLCKLGEVYHNFTPAGFTGVICLSESHLSLHSWPEYGRLHMDVYLSNFLKENDAITQAIFDELLYFFDAAIINQQSIRR